MASDSFGLQDDVKIQMACGSIPGRSISKYEGGGGAESGFYYELLQRRMLPSFVCVRKQICCVCGPIQYKQHAFKPIRATRSTAEAPFPGTLNARPAVNTVPMTIFSEAR